MSWHVDLKRSVERELEHLPNHVLRRVTEKLRALEQGPFPSGAKKLKGHTGYRLRIGDYRLLYEVNPSDQRITVYAVGHRRDVYR